ncbi:hypothetical protein BDM02DRAFT_3192187 [Thelephora ganbajun]|uniref:Uncharacterized protein n=1 Tax=Thelephora ganbajun TaxID=370292 RepID=A0ACB6Z1V9_THEGA|nr:hypothetical protein BDM02DRAFT_3192187 [Thelephora ganbajun]
MTDGLQKDHNCLFRGTYLMMVLDFFVLDLKGIAEGVEVEWRLAALNPLLQRQLRGLQDQETGMIKMDVGRTLDEVEEFYLKKDPLDPDNVKELLRSLVYVWLVRWSLGHLCKETNHRESYYEVYRNTRYALEVFADTENYNANPMLHDYKLQIVKNKGIEWFYRHCGLIEDDERRSTTFRNRRGATRTAITGATGAAVTDTTRTIITDIAGTTITDTASTTITDTTTTADTASTTIPDSTTINSTPSIISANRG